MTSSLPSCTEFTTSRKMHSATSSTCSGSGTPLPPSREYRAFLSAASFSAAAGLVAYVHEHWHALKRGRGQAAVPVAHACTCYHHTPVAATPTKLSRTLLHVTARSCVRLHLPEGSADVADVAAYSSTMSEQYRMCALALCIRCSFPRLVLPEEGPLEGSSHRVPVPYLRKVASATCCDATAALLSVHLSTSWCSLS